MRKSILSLVVILIAALAVAATGVWFLLLNKSIEASWCPGWPSSIRGIGEATEQVLAGPDGRVTEADRARATERARWKAHYFAQLRVAEQVGQLKIAASTTIRALGLTDQQLAASYSGAIHAARELEKEGRVEVRKDAVRARVVVEAPAATVMSLREAMIAALKSGRITVKPRAPKAKPVTVAAVETPPAPTRRVVSSTAPRSAPAGGRRASPVSAPIPAAASSPEERATDLTGCVVTLDASSGFVGPAAEFVDATGASLGSAFDLPAGRLAAGVPLAGPGDTKTTREVAGRTPLRLTGIVREGDVVLGQKLDAAQRKLFGDSLRAGKVVLVLEGSAS